MKITLFFKSFVLPLLAIATLTVACSSDDSSEVAEKPVIAQNTIHVSVGAEIADNSTTRATYEFDNGSITDYHLVFEEGDKLYLELSGQQPGATYGDWLYRGVLEYQGNGVFSGDMTAVNNQVTSYDIIKKAENISAMLLPNGYGDFITYNETPVFNYHKAVAAGYPKNSVARVCEMYATSWTDDTPGKLTLEPQNAVISFTLAGLETGEEYPVQLDLTSESWSGTYSVNGSVTSDASGEARFCIGIGSSYGVNKATTYTLKIDDQTFELGKKKLTNGKVYNLYRYVSTSAAREYVDLGSETVYWLKMNVGARKETDWGLLFAWGTTRGYSSALGEALSERSWTTTDGYSFVEEMFNGPYSSLPDICDAANVNLGKEYHIPWKSEWQWLIDNCTWTWYDDYNNSGVAGFEVRSNIAGFTDNYIFLPAVPRREQDYIYYPSNYKQVSYWTGDKDSKDSKTPYILLNEKYGYGQSLTVGEKTNGWTGLSVRAVRSKIWDD